MLSPHSVSFLAVGAAAAQSVSASQPNNVGGFSASGCAGVVTAAIADGKLTITPLAAGTCTLTVSGAGGQSAPLGVTVTTTAVVSQ